MKNHLLFKEVTDRDSVTIDLIIKNFTGYAKEKILSSDFYSKLSRFNIEFFEKYKDVFDEQVKNEEFKEIVYNKYENTKELLAKPMPEGAVLKDLNDSINIDLSFEKIINNYKGKVIYVDFWASWCGPCIAEMPNSLKLQEKFKGQDIAFIYISVDNDPVGWKQFIKVLQIKGDHYRVNKVVKEEINELFNVRYIPRYILIDKDGKVVDDKAKRPGNKEVVKDMEILL
jgi:thiol-disulfide isomerase/thioredoxin